MWVCVCDWACAFILCVFWDIKDRHGGGKHKHRGIILHGVPDTVSSNQVLVNWTFDETFIQLDREFTQIQDQTVQQSQRSKSAAADTSFTAFGIQSRKAKIKLTMFTLLQGMKCS